MHVQTLRNYCTGEVVMGRTKKYNDRHVRYRARQKIAESERNRELRRLRQFYNFMVDHDFVKLAFYEMKRHEEENPQEWREAITRDPRIVQSF